MQSAAIKTISNARESLLREGLRTVDEIIRGLIPTHHIAFFEGLQRPHRERLIGRIMEVLRTANKLEAAKEAEKLLTQMKANPGSIGLTDDELQQRGKLPIK